MTLIDLHPGQADSAVDAAAEIDERVGSSYPRCADGNGTLTHLFFSDDMYDIARAKAICSKCGLASGCLGGALERAEPYGVWGGQLLVEGVVVAVKRGRGRPPKNPRVIIVDEVPLPPHLVA
jgi:WhiB family redox-sensing transcriptional regulator